MRVSLFRLPIIAAILIGSMHQSALAQTDAAKRPIDYFDQVEITFTASKVKALGAAAGTTEIPSDKVKGRLLLFVPKVRNSAEGFWETSAVRFASMSIKTGDYSFPMTRVSASIQFIDDRPMRLVVGRAPAGRDAVLPGTQDFVLTLARDSRSRNDYELEFSSFAYTLFGKQDVEFIADEGRATVKVKKEEKAKDTGAVDFGFSIGAYQPDGE